MVEFSTVRYDREQRTRYSTVYNGSERLWPGGKALGQLADDISSIPCFGSPFSSDLVIYGHCLVTLPLAMDGTLRWLSSIPS